MLWALQIAYQSGIDVVVRETPLGDRDLPTECPYTLEPVLDGAFFPGQPDEPDWQW